MLVGGAVAAWPLAARAQQPDRVRRIAVLMSVPESDPEAQHWLGAFSEGLQRVGWTAGRNIRLDYRWAAPFDAESRQRVAKELVALQPDLILAQNTVSTASILQETRSIPVIFANVVDPIGSGFVASLAQAGRQRHRLHPGGVLDSWKVAGAAQRDCTARQPGRLPVPTGSSAICPILSGRLQSRCPIPWNSGNRSTY
jgi:ABC transporter substrate binding protein